MDVNQLLPNAPVRNAPWWSAPGARSHIIKAVNEALDASEDDVQGLYVYSLPFVRENMKQLTGLKSIGKLFYAIKANPHPTLLREIHAAGVSFECVSLGELNLILNTFPDIAGSRILYTPNFASRRELAAVLPLFTSPARRAAVRTSAAAAGADADAAEADLAPFFTVDNSWVLEQWGSTTLRGARVFVRVDPGEDGHGHHAHVYTGSGSKFGIEQSVLRSAEFAALLASCDITVVGLHMHKGSGINDAGEWARSAQALLTLLEAFPKVTHIDLGGGLGVPYKPSDSHLDLSSLDAALLPISEAHPSITFCIEPGRFFVAQAGVLVGRVTQLKHKGGHRFVGLTCGMTHLIRPALYGSYHHIVNISKYNDMYLREAAPGLTSSGNPATAHFTAPVAPAGETSLSSGALVVDVVGPICETGDFIGKARVLPADTDAGDIVCIDNAGAYGRVMASDYNFRAPGPDMFIEEDF